MCFRRTLAEFLHCKILNISSFTQQIRRTSFHHFQSFSISFNHSQSFAIIFIIFIWRVTENSIVIKLKVLPLQAVYYDFINYTAPYRFSIIKLSKKFEASPCKNLNLLLDFLTCDCQRI